MPVRPSSIIHQKYGAEANAGSCGAIVDPALLDSWTCELCNNEESLEASIVGTPISHIDKSSFFRLLIVCSVRELPRKRRRNGHILPLIPSYEPASQPRGKDGHMCCVRFSHLRSLSPMLHVYDLSKV